MIDSNLQVKINFILNIVREYFVKNQGKKKREEEEATIDPLFESPYPWG